MDVFKVKTKNKLDISKKPRVYFTCHPDDFEKYFEKICQDIFKVCDCAIYYTEDMAKIIPDDEKETDFERINLFVIPVTNKLLTTPNRAMDEDICYAHSRNIPILPLMMESGLDQLYSKPDKFGTLQYLNPNSNDLTEIFYEDKLKNFLASVLTSPEQIERIQKAFDAYIFLSYRKMNRKYANELMRFIHSFPECRDIAIWFDEFLTPGESFSESIEEKLEESEFFTLVVTPDIFKKVKDLESGEIRDNYVISNELPMAQNKREKTGFEIIAVEMEETDREGLTLLKITDPVIFKDEEFKNRILNAISKINRKENNSPEHIFLIGLAYLEGIDVEVNRDRGIELITKAAEEGYLDAMKKLCDMYREGIGVTVDFKKAIKWYSSLYNYCRDTYGDNNKDTLLTYGNLAYCYHYDGNYEEAIKIYKNIYKNLTRTPELADENTSVLINNMASILLESGNVNDALKYHKKAYEVLKKLRGEKDPLVMKIISNLGSTYDSNGFPEEGLRLCTKAYNLQKEVLEENHPDTLLSLNNMACANMTLGNLDEALSDITNAYNLSVKARGKEYPDSLLFLVNMAVAYSYKRDFNEAKKYHQEAYDLRCKVLGDTHPDSILSLHYLASAISDSGLSFSSIVHHEKALKLAEKYLGEKHTSTPLILNGLAKAYHETSKYDEAFTFQERAYNLYCGIYGDNHPKIADPTYNFAVVCADNNKPHKAYELFKKAYEIQLDYLGKSHPYTMDSLYAMTKVSFKIDCDDIYIKYKKAASALRKVYEFRLKAPGVEKIDTLDVLKDLADCQYKLGNTKEAYSLYKKALVMEKEVYPDDYIRHKETQAMISRLETKK